MRFILVGPVMAQVAAPPALVFQMLAAIGQGSQPNGERVDILRGHFDDVLSRAEARAARSRVFARAETADEVAP